MSLLRLRGPAVLVAAALLVPACGGTGGGNASLMVSDEARRAAQVAAPAVSAADLAVQAANDDIVDTGNPGTTSAKVASPSPTSIQYSSALHLTVDLAMTDAYDQPKYPGASGLLDVSASGTINVSGGSGTATYMVTLQAMTDLSFTDPVSGDSASIAPGAEWAYSLMIHWEHQDGNTWSISAESQDTLGGVAFTTHHGTEVVTGTLAGNRHETVTFAKTAGVFGRTASVTADWTVTFTDSTGIHTVTLHVDARDSIMITVDGIAYGPLTRAQVVVLFELHCN